MCNPALLLGAGGAVVSGISAAAGMATQSANYRIQQQAADRDAALAREQGAYEGARTYEQGRRLIGKQVAGYAGAGISPSSGTPLDVITGTGADVGLDVAAARYGTSRAIEGDQYKAKVAGMNASNASAAMPLAFLSPILSSDSVQTGFTYLRGAYA
jgi:hypothetical protein